MIFAWKWRVSLRVFGFRRLPQLVKAKIGQFSRQADPLIDKFSKSTIVFQLLLNLWEFRIADKACRAFTLPGKAELIIRSVLDGRRRLTSATRITADVVLLGYRGGWRE